MIESRTEFKAWKGMLDGNNFLKAGWVHGLKLHEYSIAEGSRYVVMGKVSYISTISS